MIEDNLESNEPTNEPPNRPVKNILKDIEYIEPDLTIPIPEGMCFNCDVESN